MEIENNEMVVRLHFDRPLSDEEAARMAGVMAEEMEFRDPSGGRYTSPGWGIGKARVLGVTQLLPGEGFAVPGSHEPDSDAALAAIVGFCSLRPGEDDPDFFARYTERQLAFAREHGEGLARWAAELQGGGS